MLRNTLHLYKEAFNGLSKDIWLLSFVTLINRSGTMVIPFLTVYMTIKLEFSLAQAGLVMSCFGMGSVLGAYIGGRLTDSIGYYWVQFWSLLLTGFMFMLLGQVHTLSGFCLAVFSLSTIADAFRPANYASVAVYSKPSNRTRSYSLLRMAVNLGFTAGPAIGGFLAATKGYDWLFWVDGFTCVVAAILFRFLLNEKRETISQDDMTTAEGGIKSAYRDRTFLFFMFLTTIGAVVFFQIFVTVPVFLKQDFNLHEGHIGALMAVNGLLIAMTEVPIVFQLEKRFTNLSMICKGILIIGLSFVFFNIPGPPLLIALAAFLMLTVGEIFTMPFTNAYAVGRSGPGNRGQYMALYTMAYSTAHIIAPTFGMQVAEHFGFATLWYIVFFLCLTSFSGMYFLRRSEIKRVPRLLGTPNNTR